MRNLVWIVLDSARYDAVIHARTPALKRLGPIERRWSYASWTAPSHLTFLMGLLPHRAIPGMRAAHWYREDFAQWSHRLGAGSDVTFSTFAPSLSMPRFLKELGYRCEARMSLPVLNTETVLSAHFDRYEMLPIQNDLAKTLAELDFSHQPAFHFINTAETHYPYLLPGETVSDLPLEHGVHGVWKTLDAFLRDPASRTEPHHGAAFDTDRLRPLWQKQVRCVEYVDAIIGNAYASMPEDTWIIVTSDHGELFGEDGWFGHGPVVHDKVLEVFLVEGMNPAKTRAFAM